VRETNRAAGGYPAQRSGNAKSEKPKPVDPSLAPHSVSPVRTLERADRPILAKFADGHRERDTDTDSDSDSAQAKNTQQGGEAAAQQASLGAVCRRRTADNIGSDSDSSSYRQFQHPYHPLAFACTIFCTLAPQYTTRDSSKTTAFCLLTLLNSTFRLVSILEISNYH
jgi:hypothetical protein